ncbi:MAG: hypothetical protein AAFQ58_23550 [Pseudomonadota bacterium]
MTYTLIPGQSHAADEEETLSMIRSVLTEDMAQTADPAPRTETPAQPAFVDRTTPDNQRRRAADLPELEAQEAPAKAPRTPLLGSLRNRLAQRAEALRAFRPTTRHLAIVSALLLVVLRPHWFVIGAVLMLALIIAAFMILGPDRIWRGVVAGLDRIAARNPARATRLRQRLDRFAYRWDAVLDLFPEGMVDALYMPDLQGLQDADAAHTDAMDQRLTRMAHDG